jgi:leader peptidase (prepilin peptidase)/N-methyltransferase
MFDFLNSMQPMAAWLGALLGLVIGSFLNVVIHRTPLILEQQWLAAAASSPEETPLAETYASPTAPFNLSTPRSHCPHCHQTLAWWDNLPVVSFLLLKGRCRHCHAPIGWRYPMVEIFTALLVAWCFDHWGLGWQALAWSGFVCTLVALAGIDWDTTLLPDHLTQPLTWAGLILAAWGMTGLPLSEALWGAVAGYLSLWLVYWLFKLFTGKEGMGYGDFKLFAALGAWFGWSALIPLILLASLAGIGVGLVLKYRQQLRENHYIPFGPFLAMAAWVYMIWGHLSIFNWLV